MPNKARTYTPGSLHHIVIRGIVRKGIFKDNDERKLTFKDPKSGRSQEAVFIPQKVAERPKDYGKENSFQPGQRIFPVCYESARAMVKKVGDAVGVKFRPHDLRRHAATHASRSGVPVDCKQSDAPAHQSLHHHPAVSRQNQ